MTLASFRTVRAFVLICFSSIILADWLFYAQSIGSNLVVFHCFVLILAILQAPALLRQYPALVLLLAGLLIAMAAQPGPIIVLLFWSGVVAVIFAVRQGWTGNTLEWTARWLHFGLSFWFGILRDLFLIRRCRKAGHGKQMFVGRRRAVANWTLPGIGSIVFLSLFCTANPVLSYWFDHFIQSIDRVFDGFVIQPPRLILWCFIAMLVWALLRIRVRGKKQLHEIGDGRMLPPLLLVRCLALFNAVFAIQTILDAIYLWGGSTLPSSMTYAEYAHRGAYPLIATALLSGGFVLATFRAGLPTHEAAVARKLVFLWLAQNVLLTFNSLWRLHLYIEIYSLTRLRLAAAIWMGLVSLGLILLTWRIYAGRSNGWLLNANFVSLLAVLYLCSFVNFDGIISHYNVQHSKELTGQGVYLDILYLEREIGVESIPALIHFYRRSISGEASIRAESAIRRLNSSLENDLGGWRSRTYRKSVLQREIIHATRNPEPETRVSIRFADLSVL